MTTRTSRPISGSAEAGPAATDIHSCGYFCDRPACIKAQRDMLPALHHTLAQTQLDLTAQTAECFALRAELKELDALKADIANALTDLTDYSIENDALRARVAELEQAIGEVMTHRVGTLPREGYLRDNVASRAALHQLDAARKE